MTRCVLGDRVERKVPLVNWDPITSFRKDSLILSLGSSQGSKAPIHFAVVL